MRLTLDVKTSSGQSWTSCSLYCQEDSKESFVDPRPILRLVHADEGTARKKYRQILQQAQGSELQNALEQEGVIEKYIGEQLMARGVKKTEIAARLGVSQTRGYNILNTSD